MRSHELNMMRKSEKANSSQTRWDGPCDSGCQTVFKPSNEPYTKLGVCSKRVHRPRLGRSACVQKTAAGMSQRRRAVFCKLRGAQNYRSAAVGPCPSAHARRNLRAPSSVCCTYTRVQETHVPVSDLPAVRIVLAIATTLHSCNYCMYVASATSQLKIEDYDEHDAYSQTRRSYHCSISLESIDEGTAWPACYMQPLLRYFFTRQS